MLCYNPPKSRLASLRTAQPPQRWDRNIFSVRLLPRLHPQRLQADTMGFETCAPPTTALLQDSAFLSTVLKPSSPRQAFPIGLQAVLTQTSKSITF